MVLVECHRFLFSCICQLSLKNWRWWWWWWWPRLLSAGTLTLVCTTSCSRCSLQPVARAVFHLVDWLQAVFKFVSSFLTVLHSTASLRAVLLWWSVSKSITQVQVVIRAYQSPWGRLWARRDESKLTCDSSSSRWRGGQWWQRPTQWDRCMIAACTTRPLKHTITHHTHTLARWLTQSRNDVG